MKRRYPLFIIDTSRAHGRELETDYLSCTSLDLPFVAEVTYINEAQFEREYDKTNVLIKYGLSHNGFRIRIEVVQIRPNYDATALRMLLQRALKEVEQHRSATRTAGVSITHADKISFVEELIRQGHQQHRMHPDNSVICQSLAILESLKDDLREKDTL